MCAFTPSNKKASASADGFLSKRKARARTPDFVYSLKGATQSHLFASRKKIFYKIFSVTIGIFGRHKIIKNYMLICGKNNEKKPKFPVDFGLKSKYNSINIILKG